jgi:predicted XRE-type DNA-binding protein
MNKKEIQNISYTVGSGNVYADLGLDNAEELQARSLIGFYILEILKDKNLKQKEIAILLNVKQAEVSHLMNGHFSRFTTDKLLDFLKKLNYKVTFQISEHKKDEAFYEVRL